MRSISTSTAQRGDTLIEVLVSIAVLGALISISYAVMNRGYASAHNSLDQTTVQALVSSQASLLRAAHGRALSGNTKYWDAIIARTVPDTGITGVANACSTGYQSSDANKLFYFEPTQTFDATSPTVTGPLAPQPLFPDGNFDASKLKRDGGLPLRGQGLWIEGYKTTGAAYTAYTFYIKSCWAPTYNDGVDTDREAKTVVRLYAP